MTEPALRITGLTKNYGTVPALRGLDLELTAGRLVALLGENGCGKTTLLKILAGLDSAYGGQVRLHGHAPGVETKALVSFLPDESFLPDAVDARSAVAMFADFFADFDRDRALDMITGFGLPTDRRLKELSKGQREKVQLSLAIGRRAKVYLLDEPISGVDPAARGQILSGIIGHYDPEALLIMSTHLVADIEPIADTVVFIRDGRVLLAGDADDLRAEQGMSLDAWFRTAYHPAVPSLRS